MAFRVKDLMISLIPNAGEGPSGFQSHFLCHHCGWMTMVCTGPVSRTGPLAYQMCPPETILCDRNFTFTNPPTGVSALCCGPWSTVAGPVGVPPGGDPAAMAEQLAAVKAQLREAIAQIENQEKVVSELAQPQTVAEIEQLEAKLEDALKELEHRKSELKKKQ